MKWPDLKGWFNFFFFWVVMLRWQLSSPSSNTHFRRIFFSILDHLCLPLIPLPEMFFHPFVSSYLVPTSHFVYSTFPNTRLACVPNKYPIKSCWTLYALLSSKSHLALSFTTLSPPQPEYKLLGRPIILSFSFTTGSSAEVWAQIWSVISTDHFRQAKSVLYL